MLRFYAFLRSNTISFVDVVPRGSPLLNIRMYLSQPGLRPMRGQIRNIEYGRLIHYILTHCSIIFF